MVRAEKEREVLNKQLPNAAKAEAAVANSSSNNLFSGKVFKNIYKSAIGLVAGGKKEYVSFFEANTVLLLLERLMNIHIFLGFLVSLMEFAFWKIGLHILKIKRISPRISRNG